MGGVDRAPRLFRWRGREHEETLHDLEHACELAACQPGRGDAIERLGGGWVAEEALAIVLYCALSGLDFESAVVLSVNHSVDSDSTRSITGSLLGAALGAEAIPQRWLDPLELREVIGAMADDLATVREWEVDNDETGESAFWWKRYPGG